MPWGLLDDQLHQNGKVLSFTDREFRLWMYSISFCLAKWTRDPGGRLTRAEAEAVRGLAKASPAVVAGVIEKHGWDQLADGCYQVHDIGEYAPKAKSAPDEALRTALSRTPGLRGAVKERDGDHCRYCGTYVRWKDRKGAGGGTFDLIDPDGPVTDRANIIVACRACADRRAGRPLGVAGMVLRAAPRSRSDLDQKSRSESRSDLDRSTQPTESTQPMPRPVPRPSFSERLPEQEAVEAVHTTAPAAPERSPAPRVVSLEPRYSDEFEAWWSAYPRKREKVEAFALYEKTLKAGATAEELLAAARNYAIAADEEGAEDRHIKLPATFLSLKARPWLDFRKGVPRSGRTPKANGRPSPLQRSGAILSTITDSEE